MFDIGWSEMLVIAIVLIVVVGPKDLPKMLRTFGRTTTKLRAMAGDFRKQFDEALKEAELDDVKGLVDDVRKLNPANEIKQALNPMQKAASDIRAGLDSAMNPKKPAAAGAAAAAAAAAKPGDAAAEQTAGPLPTPDVAPAPGDFFPPSVDPEPAPAPRAAEPLKNGATHATAKPPATTAPAAAKPAPAARARPAAPAAKPAAAKAKPAASVSAAKAKPAVAPAAKAKEAASRTARPSAKGTRP